MKFLLSLIICSQVCNACLDPFPWQTTFNTQYDCLRFGYQESIKKLDEIGKIDHLEKEINKTARSFALNNTKQEENAINALKTVCRKFTKEQVGKRPFTNINLVNI